MNENELLNIDVGDDIRARIEAHLVSMDQYAIFLIRAAAEIEIILSEALKSKFVNQINLKRVVGESFGWVISLSFAIGVIHQKTYESLLNLQSLRNTIAHSSEHHLKLKESLDLVLFLGATAHDKVEQVADSLSNSNLQEGPLVLCHKAALQLLVQKVKDEVLA
jgi:hypothetical protein